MCFRGFYYNEKLKDFTIYYNEHANLKDALERYSVIDSSLECDYCNYSGLGNDYTHLGTVDDLLEQF